MSAKLVEWGGPIPVVENARHVWSERRGILLALEADGVSGFGEATPLLGYGGGELAAARDALSRAPFDELLALTRPEDIAAAITTLVPCARFCLETALYDRLARLRDLPLADLLAGRSISKPVPRARFGGMLGDVPPEGGGALKLKARGSDLAAERLALAQLRRTLGDVEIRLDLNGALDVEGARRALDLYAEFGIRWVEEPVSGRALLQLGKASVPWIADESLTDPTLADELLDSDACFGLVVKPTLFGLDRARVLLERAQRSGKIALVSHCFEGPVALAACAELALSQGLLEACGVDRHHALSAFPPCELPQLPDGPYIVPVARHGLGITWR